MKKLKVAVQFFGHLRTFERCYLSVKEHLLDLYDCDVFFHTWSKINHSTHVWSDKSQKIEDVDEQILNKLKQFYNPKLIAVEEQFATKSTVELLHNNCDPNRNLYISSAALKFMYYSKQKVNELRQSYQLKNNIQYDYVIMIRPDIQLLSHFYLENIGDLIHITNSFARFCTFNINPVKTNIVVGNQMSDIFYFGTPSVIDSVVNILSSIDFKKFEKIGIWNVEMISSSELLKNGIGSYFIPYLQHRDWLIVRFPTNNIVMAKKIKSEIIRLTLKKNYLLIEILRILPFSFLVIKINFPKFRIELSIGRREPMILKDVAKIYID